MRRRHYPSGLVGMDMKDRRPHRFRANRYKTNDQRRWLLPMLALMVLISLAFLAGYWS